MDVTFLMVVTFLKGVLFLKVFTQLFFLERESDEDNQEYLQLGSEPNEAI
jgi:hypothetical protein